MCIGQIDFSNSFAFISLCYVCTAVLLKTIRIMILYFDILRPLTSDVGPLYFFNAVICFIIQEK